MQRENPPEILRIIATSLLGGDQDGKSHYDFEPISNGRPKKLGFIITQSRKSSKRICVSRIV
jgi:hypothetical protein